MNASVRPAAGPDQEKALHAGRRVISTCANPRCATGWIRLWRSRRVPAFEGRWACSAGCMEQVVAAAVRRELEGRDAGAHLHRVPLGLLLVEQGRISPEQLRQALAEQRDAARRQDGAALPLGRWLVRSGVLSETALTRALGAQWSAPVFALGDSRPEELASALPAFFSETLGALPVRLAGDSMLYVAWPGRIDRTLAYALEGICGLRVSSGIARDSELRVAQTRYLAAKAPRTRLLEAASASVLARALARLIETEKPAEARLRRIHRWWWLRLWRRLPAPSGLPLPGEVEDVLCTEGHEFRRPD